ncbi:tyrosine protein phosphatase 1 [Vermiconidia calcicola]|uniref:Tyrosine protein phosphatase 1 n=1 Tax=Vermiconidia calcicola TaxID=1690605 RepID=A0ACC3MLK3_9PEZI|nr:tyrosine protein phosphatase 1 [Vermiconidia calcicola]
MAAPSISSSSYPPSLPAFLRQSKAGRHHPQKHPHIHAKFIDLEWQQRNRLLQGAQQPATSTTPPHRFSRLNPSLTATRNRYLNVEPYAQNRIKLRVADRLNDYINASPIQLGGRKYIATQGPKEGGLNGFWRMVREVGEKVVVVMLTQTHEAGREKCFRYYPLSAEESPLVVPEDEEMGDDRFCGEVELVRTEDDWDTRSQIRRMRLRTRHGEGEGEKEKEVEIHHLLFSGWPDFLIPEGDDRAALVELIHLSADLNTRLPTTRNQTNGATPTDQSNAPPRIIHCSAGVGRSGTFIALDYLLSHMQTGELDDLPPDKDPVADTVDLLRQQRMMMVQGESQFNFLYEVLRERWMARLEGGDAGGGAERGY